MTYEQLGPVLHWQLACIGAGLNRPTWRRESLGYCHHESLTHGPSTSGWQTAQRHIITWADTTAPILSYELRGSCPSDSILPLIPTATCEDVAVTNLHMLHLLDATGVPADRRMASATAGPTNAQLTATSACSHSCGPCPWFCCSGVGYKVRPSE